MKNQCLFIYICVSVIISSCSSEETLCTDIGYPIMMEFSYVDEQGNNLFAADNPRFSTEEFALFDSIAGQRIPISYRFSDDESTITAMLPQASKGQFFIELKAGVVDSIRYIASTNEADPCKALMIDELTQNGNKVSYDENSSRWLLKK